MPEYTDTLQYDSVSDFKADLAVRGALSAQSDFIVAGLFVEQTPFGYARVDRYVGERNVPADIQRQRRYTLEVMRRMGQPVLVKKLLTDVDFQQGTANESANFDGVYGQTRHYDPLSHGTGFNSKELADNEWIGPDGKVITADTQPADYVQAPKYRGYGPAYLTYVIEPDKATDYYKESPTGALIKVQEATASMPWFPDVTDNDLIINVTLDNQWRVIDVGERYQAKMTNPISIRGLDRRGRRETKYTGDPGNRYVIEQQFDMTLVPQVHPIQQVEVDR